MSDSIQVTTVNAVGYQLYINLKAMVYFQLEREIIDDDGITSVGICDAYYIGKSRGKRVTIKWDSREDEWATIEEENEVVDEGMAIDVDSLTWSEENSLQYLVWELQITIGKKAFSMLKYIEKIWNWSAGKADLGATKEIESEKVADMSKIGGWCSIGETEIDNYTSEWLASLLPQWKSNMGGPR